MLTRRFETSLVLLASLLKAAVFKPAVFKPAASPVSAVFLPVLVLPVLVLPVLVVLSSLNSSPVFANETSPNLVDRNSASPSQSVKRVVFLGDSLTAGYGLPSEESYPSILEEMLEKEGFEIEIVNGGVSGDTTAGGLRRIPWLLKQDASVFVIALGANDSLRGLSPSAAKANLAQIIETVQREMPNTEILLAGMKAPPSMGEQYVSEFDTIYQELADQYDLLLYPFLLEGVAGDDTLNLPDKLHPNPAGQRKMAMNLFPFVKQLLLP